MTKTQQLLTASVIAIFLVSLGTSASAAAKNIEAPTATVQEATTAASSISWWWQ